MMPAAASVMNTVLVATCTVTVEFGATPSLGGPSKIINEDNLVAKDDRHFSWMYQGLMTVIKGVMV